MTAMEKAGQTAGLGKGQKLRDCFVHGKVGSIYVNLKFKADI